jgi:hypothetical protein
MTRENPVPTRQRDGENITFYQTYSLLFPRH